MSDYKNRIYPLLALIVTLSVLHFILSCYYTLRVGFADIDIFLYSTLNYLHGGVLYLQTEPLSNTYAAGRAVFKFTPLYVAPYLPWLDVGIDIKSGIPPYFHNVLFWVHIIRFVFVFFLLGFFFEPRKNPFWWATLAVVFSFSAPFYEALWGLTFDNLYLFILAVSLVLIKYRQQLAAATFLMYAANAKLYPFLQLVQFVSSRNWRMVLFCTAATAIWIGVSLMFFNVSQHEFYYFRIIPVLLQEDVLCEVGNLSIAAQFCNKDFPILLLNASFIFVTFLISYIATRSNKWSFEDESLLFSFVICLPLLVIKNIWGNYQMALLVPICVLISFSFSHNKKCLITWLPCFFAFLAWLPFVLSYNYMGMKLPYYSYVDESITTFVTDDMKPLSAVILWMTLGFLLLFRKKYYPVKS